MDHIRIFLSTVSDEFRVYREKLRGKLTRPNVSVHVQEDFIATGTATLDKLDEYVKSCDAVIHLVGDMTGAWAHSGTLQSLKGRYPDFGDRLPCLRPFLEANAPLLSYTQWEAYLAIYHGKPLFVAVPEPDAPRDAKYLLDPQQRKSQQQHLERLAELGRYSEIKFGNADQLASDISLSGIFDLLVSLEARKIRPFSYRAMTAAASAVAAVAAAAIWLYATSPTETAAGLDAVAILPFDNRSRDMTLDNERVRIPAQLASILSRQASVIVRPFYPDNRFKDQKWGEVGNALNVKKIISGYLLRERADAAPKLTVEIYDVKANQLSWSQDFSVTEADSINLYNQIVRKVSTYLGLSLQNTIGTKNTKAFGLYLRGYTWGLENNTEASNRAIRDLKEAVQIDPSYPEAHAVLARLYATRYSWNISNEKSLLDDAVMHARLAIKLNPKLPEAQYALGYVMEVMGNKADAIRSYREAIKVGPHFVRGLLGNARFSLYMGDFDRAIATLDKVATIDTLYNVHLLKSACFYFSGRSEDSLRETQAAEAQLGSDVGQLTVTAYLYIWLKNFDAAERILGRLRKDERSALSIKQIRAWLETIRSAASPQPNFADARKLIDEILAERQEFGIYDEIAALYAIQGDRENAIKFLDKAVELGAPYYAMYRSDFFKQLRGDPRYEKILKKLDDEYRPLLSKTN